MKKKKDKKKKEKRERYFDKRINAPLISWKTFVFIFITLYMLILVQAFIFSEWFQQIETLVGALAYYTILTCLLLTVFYGMLKRYIYGKPLRKISKAAKKITEGDFSARVSPNRDDGLKDEIEVLIDDFNTMARELESIEVLKNDFISNVSHEIKSPLSVIQSYAAAMKDPSLSPEQREQYADILIDESKKMNTMINNILKLNRLQNQEISPAAKPFQLGEQLRKEALVFMKKWEEKDIDFKIDVADIVINYDESLLGIIWSNLLSNAVKFTEQGGTIILSSYKKDGFVFVKVKDTGCGMSEEVKSRIFDKFYQGDLSHATEGNGLGLALVKRVLEIIDGEITVESEIGKGSTFSVKLKV